MISSFLIPVGVVLRSSHLALLTVTLTMAGILTPAAAADNGTKADATADDQTMLDETMSVIVELVDLHQPGDADLIAELIDLADNGIESKGALDRLDVMEATVTAEGMAALAASPLVESVREAREFRLLLDSSAPTVGAPALHTAGRTGSGKVVAIIDSGVDSDHSGLAGSVVAEACFLQGAVGVSGKTEIELCGNTTTETQMVGTGAGEPCSVLPELCTHGTHVAGVVSGDDATLTGIAPDAGIFAIRVTAVLRESGVDDTYIPELGVLAALDHVYEMRDSFDISSVNLSLGGDPGTCQDAAWEDIVSLLTGAGIAVVAASGNEGSQTSIAFPACLEDVVSVGATRDDGSVAGFSNSSGLLDVLAPGKDISSTALISYDASGFASLDGTSFSAPHVAAAFALLDGSQPNFTPDRMRDLMRATGEMITRETANPFDHDPRFPELRLEPIIAFEPFTDADYGFWVSASDWAKHVGISTGPGGGVFDPDGQLTRAQAVTFLWRFMGEPVATTPSGFVDVAEGQWYSAAVDWAAEAGVTTGVSPGVFAPDDVVSRAQLATFMWRTAGEPLVGGTTPFVDVVAESFYEDAVVWMAANEITTGTTATTFSPDDVVNRAQMVTFLHRLADADNAWFGSVAPPLLALF